MEVMTYFHYGRQQRGGGGEVEGWGWNSWHSTDEMGVIWVFGCCYGETKMSLFQKYILDFAWCSPCPLSVYFALWSSFPHISACYCYILMCVCVCVCVCVFLPQCVAECARQGGDRVLAAACEPGCSALRCQWQRARGTSPDRGCPSWANQAWALVPSAVCSAVSQIPLWILMCSPQCWRHSADRPCVCLFR